MPPYLHFLCSALLVFVGYVLVWRPPSSWFWEFRVLSVSAVLSFAFGAGLEIVQDYGWFGTTLDVKDLGINVLGIAFSVIALVVYRVVRRQMWS